MTAASDPAAVQRQSYAAGLASRLVEDDGLDATHAANVAAKVAALVNFGPAGMTVTTPDGADSTIIAELARIKVEVPFAFARSPIAATAPAFDLKTAAGRRAAETAETYRKATSDGNPFKKRYWNLTHQVLIEKRDPALAKRMREAAKGQ